MTAFRSDASIALVQDCTLLRLKPLAADQQFSDVWLSGVVNVDQRPYRYVSEEDFKQLLNLLHSRRLRHHKKVILDYLGPESREEERVVD